MSTFSKKLQSEGLDLRRDRAEILQVNVGKLCNLTCVHCHVNAGPKRKEIMTRETVDRILDWLRGTEIDLVDLTGGAPEMIPDFKYFVEEIRGMGKRVMDRCNLTILLEEGFEGMAEFLAEHKVEIVASMPCYSPDNVEEQRGEGVFDASIKALQKLNELGYGKEGGLLLDLVYNPNGAFLPGDQQELESSYKRELKKAFGIEFNRLFAITNLPIARFASYLKRNKQYEEYMQVLMDAFNPHSVQGLMCRNTVSVGWQGEVYDCDFNQQMGMQLKNGKPLFLWDIDLVKFREIPIMLRDHCFGCTAGSGSSCTGSLT